jgi:hypothetical protein
MVRAHQVSNLLISEELPMRAHFRQGFQSRFPSEDVLQSHLQQRPELADLDQKLIVAVAKAFAKTSKPSVQIEDKVAKVLTDQPDLIPSTATFESTCLKIVTALRPLQAKL